MAYEKITYDVGDNGVATIALDDPETRNSLSPELLGDLLAGLAEAKADAAVRCVVLTSTHEKVFSSGGNLAAFGADAPLIERYEGTKPFVQVFQAIGELGKPTIVAAN